ncbi:MAG: hypothetical protein JXA67_09115 [Micromonosporaceae bacterium]|nr:hypothetical protein [Micromonosporaceae bacterium]
MAYIVPPAPPAVPRQRPGVVTAGVTMVAVVALLQFIGAAMTVVVAPDMRDIYLEALEGQEGSDAMGDVMMFAYYFGAGVSVLVGIGLAVLALFDAQGKQAARIVTWVLGGLYLCCAGGGLALSGAGTAFSGGDVDTAEVERLTEEILPSWYAPFSTASSAIALLAMLAAVILLALPAANEYFRKPAELWEPPVPSGGVS